MNDYVYVRMGGRRARAVEQNSAQFREFAVMTVCRIKRERRAALGADADTVD